MVEFLAKDKNGNDKIVSFERSCKRPRQYKDNAKNRRLGRVGQEIPMSLKLVERAELVKSGQVQRDEKGRLVKQIHSSGTVFDLVGDTQEKID